MFKKVFVLSAILVLILANGVSAADNRLSVGASSLGSSSYSKISVWTNTIGELLDLNITPEGSAGSVANVQLTEIGDVDLGSTMSNITREGWDGVGFSEGRKLRNIRLLTVLDSFALQFYALADSGIEDIYDLDGKHISLSKAGSGTDSWARRVFEILDIHPNISNVSPTEANALIRDGALDAAGCMGSIHPAISELNATHDIVAFGTGEATDQILERYSGMFNIEIKAGAYEGFEQSFNTIGEKGVLVANSNMSEEMAYNLVKTTYEYKDKLAVGYPGFKSIDPEDIKFGLIPLHKGAYRYYQEQGVELPEAIQPID